MTFGDLRANYYFKYAILNEIAINKYSYRVLRLDENKFNFPRPFKLSSLISRNPRICAFASSLFTFIWHMGGAEMFLSLNAIRILVRWILKRGLRSPLNDGLNGSSPCFIRFSDLPLEKTFSQLPFKSVIILDAPWITARPCNLANFENVSILSRVEIKDLLHSFKRSLLSIKTFRRNRHLPQRWIFESYSAFQWHLIWSVVSRIRNPLLTMEHFDRWAVLMDGCANQSQQLLTESNLPKLTLIQHGSLSLEVEKFNLPYKLKNIGKYWCFDSLNAELFRRYILNIREQAPDVEHSYFQPRIVLTEIFSQQPSVLFIGHPSCIGLQKAIYESLIKRNSFNAFYKPHPRCPIPRESSEVGWKVIANEDLYPKVSIVVSYKSTLAHEYRSHNIYVVEHSFSSQPVTEAVADLCGEIESLIYSEQK